MERHKKKSLFSNYVIVGTDKRYVFLMFRRTRALLRQINKENSLNRLCLTQDRILVVKTKRRYYRYSFLFDDITLLTDLKVTYILA